MGRARGVGDPGPAGDTARGILDRSPFETLDLSGVGALVRTSVERARVTRPAVRLVLRGEHAGDAASIAFFDELGLDYISCSSLRVPVARLEAGRATLRARSSSRPALVTAVAG